MQTFTGHCSKCGKPYQLRYVAQTFASQGLFLRHSCGNDLAYALGNTDYEFYEIGEDGKPILDMKSITAHDGIG